jgi:hypothetical protein
MYVTERSLQIHQNIKFVRFGGVENHVRKDYHYLFTLYIMSIQGDSSFTAGGKMTLKN